MPISFFGTLREYPAGSIIHILPHSTQRNLYEIPNLRLENSLKSCNLRGKDDSRKEKQPVKYVGAHVSAEGGVDKAPGNAASIGARALALFTRNQRQWQAKRLSAEEVAAFRTNCREAGYSPAQILAHDSYLINLGHPESRRLEKSRRRTWNIAIWAIRASGFRPSVWGQ